MQRFRTFATKGQARREIFEYIEVYYNNQRLHSVLGYQTPSHYETELSRVIDIGINSPKSIDVASEDRALQGCNASADATLHTAGRALPEQAQSTPTGKLGLNWPVPGQAH
jgi:hypothetical protein